MLRQMGVLAAPKTTPPTDLGGVFHARIEQPMTAPTTRISAQLVRDLNETLMLLKRARIFDDYAQVIVLERRLDWLCDKLPKPQRSSDAL